MYFVFRWKAPCKAATAEGLPSLNIFNNNNNNNNYNNNNTCINIARKTLHLGRRRIYHIAHENWWCSF